MPDDDAAKMSHWNYRTFVRTLPTGAGDYEDQFFIGEAYYDDNGNVIAWSSEPSWPSGTTKVECYDDLARMMESMGKEVLVLDELERIVQVIE
jgi:hypothetical protein